MILKVNMKCDLMIMIYWRRSYYYCFYTKTTKGTRVFWRGHAKPRFWVRQIFSKKREIGEILNSKSLIGKTSKNFKKHLIQELKLPTGTLKNI